MVEVNMLLDGVRAIKLVNFLFDGFNRDEGITR